jgi:hypothetical protein
MSYDMLLFDPAHAPRERGEFLEWWEAQPPSSNDPTLTTTRLRAWFMEMIERVPALNGPYASARERRDAADYSIGQFLIYVALYGDKQAGHERTFELAGKHGLGLYECSSPDGEIWLPGTEGTLVLASTHVPRQPQPVTDSRAIALAAAHPAGGTIVWAIAFAEDPRRMVNVVYSARSPIEAIVRPSQTGAHSTLVELKRSLAAAGIVFAVIEEHEQLDFARQVQDALSAARSA